MNPQTYDPSFLESAAAAERISDELVFEEIEERLMPGTVSCGSSCSCNCTSCSCIWTF
jgi:hypothetical protein